VSDRNQDSDLYRTIEKADIVATIRSSPILGIGFGHPFLRPIPLPPINLFLLSPYMPHNAILWMWMKVGALGFLAMVYLFGLTLVVGTRNVLRMPHDDYAAITLTSLAFVLMYAIFSYVDISWDAQNMVIMAVATAQIASAPRLTGTAGPDLRRRRAAVPEPADDPHPATAALPLPA
jgi:O-antigen ligase